MYNEIFGGFTPITSLLVHHESLLCAFRDLRTLDSPFQAHLNTKIGLLSICNKSLFRQDEFR